MRGCSNTRTGRKQERACEASRARLAPRYRRRLENSSGGLWALLSGYSGILAGLVRHGEAGIAVLAVSNAIR
jgi:hypothetical protein